MRGQSLSEDLLGASSQNLHQRRTIAAQVGRLIDRMTAVVSLRSLHWQEPLRVLLTHPRPPAEVQAFHKRMRAACRRTRYDEQFVDQLKKAGDATLQSHELGQLLSPIRLVLTAAMGALSARPRVSMIAARQIIQTTGLPEPLPLSFATTPERCYSLEVLRGEATTTVAIVVQQAVSTLLREQALGREGFASWDRRDIIAGLEALWLAYTYCECGTAESDKLSAEDLLRDWERCGAPLWQRLDDTCRLMHASVGHGPYSDKAHDAGRLSLAVSTAAVAKADPPFASSSPYPSDSPVASPPADGLTHVVCRTPIPSSSDKQDKEEIARHRILETPLPVVPMPSLQSLESSRATLLAEFPWASATVEVIFDDLLGRANLGVRELTLPPTLLVGLPGAGKSRLARRIAEILDLARLDIALAGTSDTKIIGGTSRGWASGRPSDLASLLARRRTASAIVLLDEIDKASDSHRAGGGICAYLLGLLEPETAARHYDPFLKVECDYSRVAWLCTANALSSIPKPLQSRLRILVVPQPKAQHFAAVSGGVVAELEQRWQLPAGTLPPVGDLRIDWARLGSARQVRVATEASIGDWARSVVKH
jgi:hypothetical protein